MFPGSGAVVHRNLDGEVIYWDYPSDPEEYALDDYEERESRYLSDPRYLCDECGEHADDHDDLDHVFRPIGEAS